MPLNDTSRDALSRRVPGSQLNYPSLLNAQAGRPANMEMDAIGRALIPNMQRAQPATPNKYYEDILKAVQDIGGSPSTAPYAQPDQPQQGRLQMPQTPGGIGNLSREDYQRYMPETGGRRPPSARLQALAVARKRGGTF